MILLADEQATIIHVGEFCLRILSYLPGQLIGMQPTRRKKHSGHSPFSPADKPRNVTFSVTFSVEASLRRKTVEQRDRALSTA